MAAGREPQLIFHECRPQDAVGSCTPGLRNDHETVSLENLPDHRVGGSRSARHDPPRQEAEAGHRPFGRDDPRLRGGPGKPGPELQHGRADLGPQAACRPGGSQGNADPQDRQRPDRDHPSPGHRRGGRGSQEDAHRRGLARVPHPGQPQARQRGDRPGTGPPGTVQAPAKIQVGPPGRDLDRHEPDLHRRFDHRPPAEVEEGSLCGDRGRPDRERRRGDRPDGRHSGQPEHRQHADPGTTPRSEVDQLLPDRVQPQQASGRRSQQPAPRRQDRSRGEGGAGAIGDLHPLRPRSSERDRQATSRGRTPPRTNGFSRPSGSTSTARERGGSDSSPASTFPKRETRSSINWRSSSTTW